MVNDSLNGGRLQGKYILCLHADVSGAYLLVVTYDDDPLGKI